MSENLTKNSLATKASGENITTADAQLINDYNSMPGQMFAQKYGMDTLNQMSQQADAVNAHTVNLAASNARSNSEFAADALKNIITGGLTGITGTAALVSDLAGFRPGAKALSKLTKQIQEESVKAGSLAEQAQGKVYQFEQEGLQNRIDREYEEDIASGKSSTEAKFAKFAREALGTGKNIIRSGQFHNIAAQGVGSIISGGAITKGTSFAGNLLFDGAKYISPNAVERAITSTNRFLAGSPTATKIAKASPWMASMGLQEGGGQYTQELLDGLNMTTTELYQSSPAFVETVSDYMKAGKSKEEAEQLAKEDMAYAAARSAGIKTGLAAMAANYFTAPLAKPFTRGLKSSQELRKYIGEALPEVPEEALSEGLGQLATNMATRDYLNKNQDLMEGVAQSTVEGGMGGIGMGGLRAMQSTVPAGKNALNSLLERSLRKTPTNQVSQPKQVNGTLSDPSSSEDVKSEETSIEPDVQKEAPTGDLQSMLDQTAKEDKEKESLDKTTQVFKKVDLGNGPEPVVGKQGVFYPISKDLEEKGVTVDTATPEDIQSIIDKYDAAINDQVAIKEQTKQSMDTFDFNPIGVSVSGQFVTNATLPSDPTHPRTFIVANGQTLDITNQLAASGIKAEELTPYDKKQLTESVLRVNPSFQEQFKNAPELYSDENAPKDLDKNTPVTQDPVVENSFLKKLPDIKVNGDPIPFDNKVIDTLFDDSKFIDNTLGRLFDNSQISKDTKVIAEIKSAMLNNIKNSNLTLRVVKGVKPEKGKAFTNGIYRDALHRINRNTKNFDNEVILNIVDGTKVEELTLHEFTHALTTATIYSWATSKSKDNKYLNNITQIIHGIVKSLDGKEITKDHPIFKFVYHMNLKLGDSVAENKGNFTYKINYANFAKTFQDFYDGKLGMQKDSVLGELVSEFVAHGSTEPAFLDYLKTGKFSDVYNDTFTKKLFSAFKEIVDNLKGLIFGKSAPKIDTATFLDMFAYDMGGLYKERHDYSEDLLNHFGASKSSQANTTEEEKAQSAKDDLKAINDYFNVLTESPKESPRENPIKFHRDLSPEVLAQQGYFLDTDGLVKPFASKETQKNWSRVMGDILGKVFKPMKRPVQLWNMLDPIEGFRQMLQPGMLLRIAQANKFTNASALVNSLSKDAKGNIVESKSTGSKLDRQSSILSQIQTFLDPSDKGIYLHKFLETARDPKKGMNRTLGEPLIVSRSVYTKSTDSKGNEVYEMDDHIVGMLAILGVHEIASIDAMTHDMKQAELSKFNITLKDVDTLSNMDGLLEPLAVQNAASALRRIMGVSVSGEGSQQESDAFFTTLAVKTLDNLIQSGFLRREKITVNTVGPNGKPEKLELHQLIVNTDYKKVFNPKSTAILSILDPNYKNTWSNHPLPVKQTINGTSTQITPEQRKTLENANANRGKINVEFCKFLGAIGGEIGLSKLLGEFVDDSTKDQFNVRDTISIQGRMLSRKLGIDFLREVAMSVNSEEELANLDLYFSHVFLRNGREMVEGAATHQNSKLTRETVNYTNKPYLDISKGELKDKWYLCMAQSIGLSVNGLLMSQVRKPVDTFLSAVKENMDKYPEVFETIEKTSAQAFINPEESNTTKETLSKVVQIFQDINSREGGPFITDIRGFNAFVEASRYNKTKQAGTLDRFASKVYLEIDGINDGPSYINSIYALAVQPFTAGWFINCAKTGNFYGVDTRTQYALNKNLDSIEDPQEKAEAEKAIKVTGTEAEDFHSTVSHKAITRNFLARIVEAVKLVNENSGKITPVVLAAQNQLKATEAMLKLFRAVGWVDVNIKDSQENPVPFKTALAKFMELTEVPSDPKDFPLTFNRELSKVLTTVIPYGSQVKGSTERVVHDLFKWHNFYEALSTALHDAYAQKDKDANDFNEVSSAELFGSEEKLPTKPKGSSPFPWKLYRKQLDKYKNSLGVFGTLFTTDISSEKGSEGQFISNLTQDISKFSTKIPHGSIISLGDASLDQLGIKDFYLTPEGEEHLVKLFAPLFGEPAHAAVVDTIGRAGMKAGSIAAVVAGMNNELFRSFSELHDTYGLPLNLAYKQEKVNKKYAPSFTTAKGNQIVIGKKKLTTSSANVWKSPLGIEATPSLIEIDEAGVSGGPVTVQATGDGTMNMETNLNKGKRNVGSVHDGENCSPDIIDAMGEITNRGSNIAQTQNDLTMLYNSIVAINNAITDPKGSAIKFEEHKGLPKVDKADPFYGYKQAMINLALGYKIDGSGFHKNGERNKAESKRMQKLIDRYLDNLANDDTFVASYAEKISKKQDPSRVLEDERLIVNHVNEQLDTFIAYLGAVSLNEKLAHEVTKDLKKTIQHMSASDGVYQNEKPLSVDECLKLLDEVNEIMPSNRQFKSFAELLAAFCNHRVTQLYNIRIKDSDVYSQKVKDAWLKLTGRDKGNSGLIDNLPEATMEPLQRLLTAPKKEKFEPHLKRVKKLSSAEVYDFLSDIAEEHKSNPIFNNLYKKIRAAIPSDLTINLVRSFKDFPDHIKDQIGNSRVNGIYTIENGKPVIYVISQSLDKSPLSKNSSDRETREIVLHELIHSVMAQGIHQYYHEVNTRLTNQSKPSKLTSEQIHAIGELESLLEELISSPEFTSSDTLKDLITILKDKTSSREERLNEALAYIFSNAQILTTLAQMRGPRNRIHTNRMKDLVKRVVTSAKRVWAKLLNIVTGSPMEKALFESDLKLMDKHSFSFAEQYGVNTLVFLNDTLPDYPDPTDPKKVIHDPREHYEALKEGKSFFSLDKDFTRQTYINKKSTFKSALESHIRNSINFKERARLKRDSFDEADLRRKTADAVEAELHRINDFRDAIINTHSFALSPKGAEAFADAYIAIMDPDVLTQHDRAELTAVYTKIAEKLSPEFLVDDLKVATKEEIEASKHIYDMILGNIPLINQNIDMPKHLQKKWEIPAILFALNLVSPSIAQKIGKLDFPLPKLDKFSINPLENIDNASKALTEIDRYKNFDNKDLTEIFEIAQKQAEAIKQAPEISNPDIVQKIFEYLNTGFYRILALPFAFSKKSEKIYKAIMRMRNFPLTSYAALTESLRTFGNRHFSLGALEVFKDMYARTPSNTKIETKFKEIKGRHDKERVQILDLLPKLLTNRFTKNDIGLTERKFFYRTLGNTDIASLDMDTAKKVLTDPKELKAEITKLEHELKSSAWSAYFDEYQTKCKQLANYLTGDRKPGHNLLTNAYAIARLFDRDSSLSENDINTKLVQRLDVLTTLYSIQNLSKGDIKTLQHFYATDNAGMEGIYSQLAAIKAVEVGRSSNLQEYQSNYVKGWLPYGNELTGSYLHVPKSKQKDFEKIGYKYLGDYKASSIDKSEPMVRMYCANPHMKEYQEGLIQNINKTAFGYQYVNRTRGVIPGNKLTDRDHIAHAIKQFTTETGDNALIPLYDKNGYIFGYERAIPAEDRELFEKDRDIFSAIAQYEVRQQREVEAEKLNKEAMDIAAEDYYQATPKAQQTEFIDLFNSTDPKIKSSMQRVDYATKRMMLKAFKDTGSFFVRKDEAWTYIGYERYSITDVWEGKFMLPKQAQKVIEKLIDGIMPNKGKYYAGLVEEHWMGLMTWGRDTIIIRSGIVPLVNFASNIVIMNLVLGIPYKDIYRLYKDHWQQTQQYERLLKEIRELKFQAANELAKTHKNQAKIDSLDKVIKLKTTEMQNLTVYRLIREGEYSTISDFGASIDQVEHSKQFIDDKINKSLSHLPKGSTIKQVASELLLTKGSESYKSLVHFTNLGDWLAKSVVYDYLRSGSCKYVKGKLNHDEARNLVSTLFVDYDQFAGPHRDYLNKTGVTWFLTFKTRMVAAAMLSIILNPSRIILGSLSLEHLGILGTPLLENVFFKGLFGSLEASLGLDMFFSGAAMHPLAVAASTVL